MKLWCLLLLPFSLARAELIDVELQLSPATAEVNSLQIGIEVPLLSDSSDTTQISGTISAQLKVDPSDGSISELTLLSGDLTATPITLESSNFFASYNLTSSTLGGSVFTPAPPAPVANNESPAELHEFTINEGNISGTAAGQALDSDFADEGNEISGTGAPGSVVLISSSLATEPPSFPVPDDALVYDIELSVPIALSEQQDLSGFPVTITSTGTLQALGQIVLSPAVDADPYLTWTEVNGDLGADFANFGFSERLPNGLLWALGYQGDDTPSILTATSAGEFSLTLPVSGTVASVTVQTTTAGSAETDELNWIPIPESQMAGGTNPIPAGSTGTLLITPDGAGPRLYRLSVASPATE